MRAKNDASFYVASPSRLFSATHAKAGEMTRTASARGGGGGGREERERGGEIFSFSFGREPGI